MKAEKVILSFVAVLIGLIAAGIAFYLYQATRTVPTSQTKPVEITSSPTKAPTTDKDHILQVDNPKDEGVFNKRQVTVSGKTAAGTTLVVSTEDGDDVVKPASNGDFTLNITIPTGTSVIQINAIFPDGTEKKEVRTVTFSTENF